MVDEVDGKSVWSDGVLAPLGLSPAGTTGSLRVDLAFGAHAGHSSFEDRMRDLVCCDHNSQTSTCFSTSGGPGTLSHKHRQPGRESFDMNVTSTMAALAVDNVSVTSAPIAFVENDTSSDSVNGAAATATLQQHGFRRSSGVSTLRCATSSSWGKRGLQFEDLDGFRPRLGRQPVDGVSYVQSGVALPLDADSLHFTGCVSRLAVNLPE